MRAILLALLAAALLVPSASTAAGTPTFGGATAGSPAASTPVEAPREQPVRTCDRYPSPPGPDGRPSHDYPGLSASRTYDERFAQLGGDDSPIPFQENDFTPQGLAYWAGWDPDGHPGRDLLLVTAYKDHEPSRMYGIDAASGKYVGGVTIKGDHVGGVVVVKGWVFVSGTIGEGKESERTIRHYSMDELRHQLRASEDGTTPWPELPELGHADTPIGNSSFLGTDGTRLYAGPFEYDKPADMQEYKLGADGELLLTGQFRIPRATQGMTVVNGQFVYSTSPFDGHFDQIVDQKASYIYVIRARTHYDPAKQNWCFRAPSRSEGMVTHGGKSYLLFESGTKKYADQNNQANVIKHVHVGRLFSQNDPGDKPGDPATTLRYTGPTTVDYHDSFTASAQLTDGGTPLSGRRIEFALGNGRSGQSCTGTTNSAGVAACELTPSQRPGTTTLTVRFAGGGGLLASTDSVTFIVRKQQTALTYTGPKKVANGTRADLAAVLTEENADGPPVSGRTVTLVLGKGEHRQSCNAKSDADGRAACPIRTVDQPLNADATVPVQASFAGDDFYRESGKRATVLLEYYTGRSYGLRADAQALGLLDLELSPTPDTGQIRTARATRTDTACTAGIEGLLLRTGTLCPKVVTRLAPGTSDATAVVQDVSLGLPGLPLVEVEGATARSTSTCEGDDSASGTTDLRLRIGGQLVEVDGEVNAEIELAGAARLVVNEHLPVNGAEHGLTVNAVHLVSPGVADVIIASATSDVHNCAD
ncbi:choice-of-anchor P family protein [Flindersiella endophytica]